MLNKIGICGCRLKPNLHVTWPLDGRCYPLHQQGPCQLNETLQWDPKKNEPFCVSSVCPPGYVLSLEDGTCQDLNTQGKYCDQIFTLSSSLKKTRLKIQNLFCDLVTVR